MAITAQDVRHLGKLASIALDEDEVARYASELEAIVAYVQQLQEVDTRGVEPIANVAGLTNIVRDDVPGPLLTQEQVLANAPQRNASAILVPKVVER